MLHFWKLWLFYRIIFTKDSIYAHRQNCVTTVCVCVQMSRCTAVKTVTSCSPQRLSCGGTRSIHAPAPAPSLTRWEKISSRSVKTAMSLSMSVKTVKRSSQMSTGTQTQEFYKHFNAYKNVNIRCMRTVHLCCAPLFKSGTTHDSSYRGEGVQVWPVPQSFQLEVQPHPSPDVTWQWQALWVWKLW